MGQSVLAGRLNTLTQPGSLTPLGGVRASGFVSFTVGLCNDLLTYGLLPIEACLNSVSLVVCWSSLMGLCSAVALGGISRALLNVVWTWVGWASAVSNVA